MRKRFFFKTPHLNVGEFSSTTFYLVIIKGKSLKKGTKKKELFLVVFFTKSLKDF